MKISGGRRRKPLSLRRYIISKWLKTKVLLQHPLTRAVVPDSRKMTRATLRKMVNDYGIVYVKPISGTYGNGVVRVEHTGQDAHPYQYQKGVKVKTFPTYEEMYKALRIDTKGKPYLAQKGIDLLKYNKRRFDLRVMVQKNLQGEWETTGVIGRIADPRKIVTNVHNGGTLMPVERLLQAYLKSESKTKYIKRLEALGLRLARQLSSRYKGLKEIGADVGLDAELKPWVLEVNTSPDPYIFKALKDRNVYRKIARYRKALSR